MLRRVGRGLRNFFIPPSEVPTSVKILPYAVLGLVTFMFLVAGTYTWEYTNSPEFCGTACHTMPPEYTAYLTSPHARIDCVECHIGRDFITTRVTRKAGDIRHIISLAFRQYEFPIRADDLQPARETCERCHFPEKFSDDSLREISQYLPDDVNTPVSVFLTMKTGGGSEREGLGRGIHWHIENEVLYLPEDEADQTIPYIRSVNADGTVDEYVDIEADFDPASVNDEDLKRMDCITCHNRITHLISPPADTIDSLLSRGLISPSIPEIRLKAEEALETEYETMQHALNGIAGLDGYYRIVHPDFYESNADLISDAIFVLQGSYQESVFPEQQADWNSHPDNVGHQDSPGCFRCHDGKHLNERNEAIRLECNLCHSIPVVAGPDDLVANLEISRGLEPASHFNPNWITLHRDVFDSTCANCHTTEDPGGVSNTSFCSNTACHGNVFTFAGFDAPALRQALVEQIPEAETVELSEEAPLSYQETIGTLFSNRCGACHGEGGIVGMNLTSYEGALEGSERGPVIVPSDPEASRLVDVQSAGAPHFGQFSEEELQLIIKWIIAGAPE